ncbi:MAG TPA: ammonia-forming cytochrome c nitrite reductase subunit c552 [Burkholderiaceae bacterium]|nr:ammonia-forming cytochrome c nitrite reductase subunit c552 [Burkholderiaceae bacterium]
MSTSKLLRRLAAAATICATALFGSSAVAQAKGPDPAYAKQQESTISQIKGNVAKSAEGKVQLVDVANCYSCHKDIKEFHMGSKHASVNCGYCHTGADQHLKNDGKPLALEPVKPSIVTRTDHAPCATCHQEQFNTFANMNYESGARVEKAHPRGVSPFFDKLMAPHGFTKEHNEPRSHIFMTMDHLVVDRAYGGRFQMKDWTYVTDAKSAVADLWNVILKDREPGNTDQKAFMPQVATAANPVCMNCKSFDNILRWKYMGDPDPKAKWSRVSKPVEFAKDITHALNCFMCHDPHSSAPRVARDALIQAVVDRGEGTYPYDKAKSEKNPMKKVTFRDGFRAIGLLSKPDSNVMCAQCHVEYNCNPGFEPNAGPDGKDKPVTMADQRANLFPWTKVSEYNAKMTDKFNFRDFRHAVTGAALNKMQHPETETFWMSKHEREGVECKDCHMRKIEKNGKTFTDHQQKSPRSMLKETCVKCHGEMTEEQAKYQIDAIQNYTRGKLIKAEYWLAQLIDTFTRAYDAGVPRNSDAVKQAQKHHYEAQTRWEWWTAENSVGFHNPQDARESLTKSVDQSQAGIKVLNDAIAALKATPVAAAK